MKVRFEELIKVLFILLFLILMANLTKLEFNALQSSGRNYLSYVSDAKIHLDAMGLGDTIKEKNKASNQNCARAMIFLRHELDEILKSNI